MDILKYRTVYFFVLSLVVGLVSCEQKLEVSEPEIPTNEIVFRVPDHFPALEYNLELNPVTTAGFELGKALFYEGDLSRDGSISCGFCHMQTAAFTQHGHVLSHGIDDQLTLRNPLPVQNLAWQPSFFWDGGVFHLDQFAVAPIEAPNEMGETLGNVLNKLRASEKYPPLFEKAFGSKEITTANFLKALAQFQLMCISDQSKYDRFIRGEQLLDGEEIVGKRVFDQKCAACHVGVLQSDFKFRNNGLPVVNSEDTGRARITSDPSDKYLFRVPSLRNVEYTGPYMHDGRFATLEEVLDHYDQGVVESETLDTLLVAEQGIRLSNDEKKALIAFLKTLTDYEFLANKNLSEF